MSGVVVELAPTSPQRGCKRFLNCIDDVNNDSSPQSPFDDEALTAAGSGPPRGGGDLGPLLLRTYSSGDICRAIQPGVGLT